MQVMVCNRPKEADDEGQQHYLFPFRCLSLENEFSIVCLWTFVSGVSNIISCASLVFDEPSASSGSFYFQTVQHLSVDNDPAL